MRKIANSKPSHKKRNVTIAAGCIAFIAMTSQCDGSGDPTTATPKPSPTTATSVVEPPPVSDPPTTSANRPDWEAAKTTAADSVQRVEDRFKSRVKEGNHSDCETSGNVYLADKEGKSIVVKDSMDRANDQVPALNTVEVQCDIVNSMAAVKEMFPGKHMVFHATSRAVDKYGNSRDDAPILLLNYSRETMGQINPNDISFTSVFDIADRSPKMINRNFFE